MNKSLAVILVAAFTAQAQPMTVVSDTPLPGAVLHTRTRWELVGPGLGVFLASWVVGSGACVVSAAPILGKGPSSAPCFVPVVGPFLGWHPIPVGWSLTFAALQVSGVALGIVGLLLPHRAWVTTVGSSRVTFSVDPTGAHGTF